MGGMKNLNDALQQLDLALTIGKITPGAEKNIRTWLTAPYLSQYAPAVAEHIAAGKWQELEDVFWTTIPFGTGGRRGRLYPIGTNAINDRTIGESAQGLADYVKRSGVEALTPCSSPFGRGEPQAAGLRNCLRHAAPLAGFRGALRVDHGRRRFQSLVFGRVPQHAGGLVPGALQATATAA